jgi:hypothetical protein
MPPPIPPTGPQNTPPGQDPQALRQTLRQLLDDQGDYNNLLKNAIADLKRMDTAYSKIEARLNSLNKDSINVKQVNQELLRLRQKEFLEGKKLSDLEKEVSQTAKDSLDRARRTAEAQKTRLAAQGRSFDVEKAMMGILKTQGDLEAITLYTQEKQLEIAKRQTEEGEKELALEKQLNKQIGVSGAAFKLFSDKLGIGTEFYSQMVNKARQLQSEGKKITFLDKLSILGKAGAAGLKEAFTDPLTALPLIGTAVGGLVKGFMKIVELGLEAQDRTTKFGRAVGLSKQEAQGVVNNFQRISLNSNSALVTIERLVESQKELTDELEINNILSDQILETNVKLKELAGLDAQTRAEIAKSSVITGKSSESITKSVLAQVTGLKSATGISFNYQKILKEASNLGGYLGLSFAKYPAQLSKSLVTVKAMGMELKQLDSLADSFLDFESSISKEFEAQLLTGKEINLTKAREAFLNNDLATAASEITNQVGSANDFLKLNRIQAESLASAFGMSRDQMGEMLKQQEMLSKLGAKQGDSAREQLKLGLERYKNQKALSAAIGEEAYQSLVNASAQEKIAGFMDKIKEGISNFIANSPLIPLVERAIDYLSKPANIKSIVTSIQGAFATMFDIFGSIAGGVMKFLNYLPGVDIDQSLIDLVERGGAGIRALNLAGSVPNSVEPGSARKDVGGSTNINTADATSMAKPSQPKVYVMVSVDPITGKSVEKVVTQEYFETHFGQMGK